MTETKTKTTAATVRAGEFRSLLEDLLRTAGTDDTLPMLVGVRLHTGTIGDGQVLVGTSTDRFSMGQAHAYSDGQLPELFLPTASCKRVIAMLKLASPAEKVVLSRDSDKLSAASDDLAVKVPVGKTEFPKTWQIFDGMKKLTPAPPETVVAFNPTVFAPFHMIAKARGENLHISIKTASSGATVIIGDHYRGLVMPVRIPEGKGGVDWVPLFFAPSEEDHRARVAADEAQAALKTKRSAAARKAAATRKANAGNAPATKTATRRPATRKKAA